MTSPRSSGNSSNHLHSVPTAKAVYVCENGDQFTPPKRMIVRQTASMSTFLDDVTSKIKANECMRDVFTARGTTRISSLSELESGRYYVVKPGRGRFKEINYQGIQPHRTPRKGQRQGRNNSSIFSRWFKEKNYTQQRNSKYDDIKPRFQDTGEPGVRVYIQKNDRPQDRSVLVLLRQNRLTNMHAVMQDINEELCKDSKFPVGYVCDMEGNVIKNTSEFQPDEFYVAVKPQGKFKPLDYQCKKHDPPNFITNPYYGTGYPRSTYIWQPINSTRPNTWTSRHNHVPPISKPSPNQSVASHPETNLRRRKIHNTHEDVHQKPVKHKRTPEKKVRQVDYDQDNSSVFRAKNQNKTTKGAKEVRETKDTKTDLPIDQVKAEEVEEELFPYDPNHLTPLELNRRPSDEDQEYSKEDYGDDRDDRRSSRGPAYTKERSDRDLNPYKVLEPIKKDNRSSTPVHDDDDDEDAEEKRKEDEAATKIQASFRGHQARQEIANKKKEEVTSQQKDTSQRKDTPQKEQTKDNLASDAENDAAAKIQAGFRGYQTRQELKAKGHKVRPPISSQGDTGDVSKVTKEEEDAAATKIQASVRGFQARKEIKILKEEKKKNEAATLIQANYKGFKVRKEMKEQKSGEAGKPTPEPTKSATPKADPPKADPPKTETKKAETNKSETDNKDLTEDEAATKIQASFRGYQTRQKIKDEQ